MGRLSEALDYRNKLINKEKLPNTRDLFYLDSSDVRQLKSQLKKTDTGIEVDGKKKKVSEMTPQEIRKWIEEKVEKEYEQKQRRFKT